MAFNDDFNRVDNAALGNGWTDAFFRQGGGATEDVFSIVSNKARGISSTGAILVGPKSPEAAKPDWDITVKMTRASAANVQGGIIGRATADNFFYRFHIFSALDLVRIQRDSSGVTNFVIASGTRGTTWNNGQILTVQFKITGTTLEAFINGSLRASGTDSVLTGNGDSGLFTSQGAGAIIDFDDYSTGPAGDNFDSVIPIRLRSIVNLDSLTPLLTRATLVFDHSIIPVTWDMCKVIINCLAGEIRAGEVEVAGKMHCLLRADQLIPLLIRARVLLDSIIPITISREGLSVFDFVIAILIRRLEAVDQTIPIQWSVLDQWVKDAASQAAAWTGDPSSESDVWVKDPASEADAWIGA